MEENVLKDFETFEEFPDKYLKVSKDSNYYYIKKDNIACIARRNIDLISSNGIDTTVFLSYYSVLDGHLVSKTRITNKTRILDGANIISLSEIFNIDNNDSYKLTKEDVDTLTDFKEENSKNYSKLPKKYYF